MAICKDGASPEHTSICHGSSVLSGGSIPVGKRSEFVSCVNEELGKAQSIRGDDRSAQGGEKVGHQKTPAFILCLVKAAVELLAGGEPRKTPPRGGFTDVGLHTGGQPRDTAWPLARETFKVLLSMLSDCKTDSHPLS
eukprot:scaffold642906_cov28-Prasinocladus_malaysianus.AAC.1